MQINIFKTSALALAITALTACSKPNEKTVESVPVSNTVPEAVEIPVSEPISEKLRFSNEVQQRLNYWKEAR